MVPITSPVGPNAASFSIRDAHALAALVDALSNPTRLRLLAQIAAGGDEGVSQLDMNEAFQLTASAVSHQLGILCRAGVTTRIVEAGGKRKRYFVNRAGIQSIMDLFRP